jgi:hypothetical protein
MKYSVYPKGHCKIYTENFSQKSNYFGLIKCCIEPPRKMYIPLLPYRSNGKLLFPLCRTCAENQQTTECVHSSEERALTGTYVTLEIDAAIREVKLPTNKNKFDLIKKKIYQKGL